MNWLRLMLLGVIVWAAGFRMCHKEQLGYRCQHRKYPDGRKECD